MVGGTPNNPLDPIVYEASQSWTPAKKLPEWISFRNPLDHIDVKALPPLKLKRRGKVLDIVSLRRNRRNALLNYRAEQIERALKDGVEKNQAELMYEKQLAELQKLRAQFSQGLLSFFTDITTTKAKQEFQNRFLETDPDIAAFDRQSHEVVRELAEINEMRQRNDEREAELQREVENQRLDLRERISTATESELESLAEEVTALEERESEIFCCDSEEEEEMVGGAGGTIAPPPSEAVDVRMRSRSTTPPASIATEATYVPQVEEEQMIPVAKRVEERRRAYLGEQEERLEMVRGVTGRAREQAALMRATFRRAQRNIKDYWDKNPQAVIMPNNPDAGRIRIRNLVNRTKDFSNFAPLQEAQSILDEYQTELGILGRQVE